MSCSRSYAPFKVLIQLFADWISRRQLDVIEYLQEENRVLKERLAGKCPWCTDAERRRLIRIA